MKIGVAKNKKKIFVSLHKKNIELHPLWLRERVNNQELLDKNTGQRLYAPSDFNHKLKINFDKKNCITILLFANGYPSNHVKNKEIKNLSRITNDKDSQIFHAGTYIKDNKIFSIGGRVLNITSASEKLASARDKAMAIINKINWTDGFFRKDIGWRVINRK